MFRAELRRLQFEGARIKAGRLRILSHLLRIVADVAQQFDQVALLLESSVCLTASWANFRASAVLWDALADSNSWKVCTNSADCGHAKQGANAMRTARTAGILKRMLGYIILGVCAQIIIEQQAVYNESTTRPRNGMAKSMNLNPHRIAAAVLCALLSGVAGARNVALLVAVGEFRDPALKTFALRGPAIDINSVQQTLSSQWGFAPADIIALRDSEATHDRILTEIAALEQRSAKGDTVLIYFSGHGTSANADENAFDLPYATGAWVPYDLDYSSMPAAKRTLIVGRRDLVPRLKRLDESGRWVVVVSDSCYSGQVVRSFGQTFSHTRFLAIKCTRLGRGTGADADSGPSTAAPLSV